MTGYTANGTFIQNGVVVGNPHQQLHDLVNPTLWTTAADSFTNSTDPSFVQGTLSEIESAIAVAPEPGGLALSRLYITVPTAVSLANPYTDPNAGAADCNAATTCNQAVYNQLLLDAKASGYNAPSRGQTNLPLFRRRAASHTPMPSYTSIFMRLARRLANR